ncbi:hypothetical protein, partial [Klebsiella pneumoniae]|uniref:hypothetical protein n=1 Tax=Klebsiella pneumoniae TaxID=573 RepID=UPI0039C0D6DF
LPALLSPHKEIANVAWNLMPSKLFMKLPLKLYQKRILEKFDYCISAQFSSKVMKTRRNIGFSIEPRRLNRGA